MKPTWPLALTLLALPYTALAQRGPDPACRALASRLVQEALDRARVAEEDEALGVERRRAAPPREAPSAARMGEAASSPIAGAGVADSMAKTSAVAPSMSARATKADGPASYSRTNTQEAAVDEGDIVKTNGRALFHVSCSRDREQSGCRDELRVYQSWPAERSKLLARLPLGDGVEQLYLDGDRALVIARAQSARGARHDVSGLAPGRDYAVAVSRVTLLDVSNPAQPRVLGDLTVEGAMVESRMIGHRLLLATRTPRLQLPLPMLAEVTQLAQTGVTDAATAIERLGDRWARFTDEDPGLPHLGNAARTDTLYGCSDLRVTEQGLAGELLNVAQIELSGEVRGAGLTGLAQNATLYASESALYVASAASPPAGSGWATASTVRMMGLDGGRPRFVAEGVVRGNLLNQFAMSEHAGHLRVATTDAWNSNNLYVLRADRGELATVGRLENLGRNERIYAVRLLGDRGYVVTFRRTDPLYTLDLSVPTRPTPVGELHIEGYSNYLHPLGDHHLLAIGQDTDAAGRDRALHLQVFDVSNPAAPRRKFHHVVEAGAVSRAQGDHHAFFFEPTTQTLSVPFQSEHYWGLLAFRVDPERGFVDLGRVNHALMYKRYFTRQCQKSGTDACERPNYWYGFVTRPAIAVDRLVAIDAHLYSVSPSGLMVHRVGDRLTETTSVLVTPPSWPGRATPRVVRAW